MVEAACLPLQVGTRGCRVVVMVVHAFGHVRGGERDKDRCPGGSGQRSRCLEVMRTCVGSWIDLLTWLDFAHPILAILCTLFDLREAVKYTLACFVPDHSSIPPTVDLQPGA